MKQELEHVQPSSVFSAQDELRQEVFRQAMEWKRKMKEKYPDEMVDQQFKEAAEQ